MRMDTKYPVSACDALDNGKSGKSLLVATRIDAAEFCDLAVSPRNLVRMNDNALGLRGLCDLDTGERFAIEERALLAHGLTRS